MKTRIAIAANDAPLLIKQQADYICDGIDDHDEIQEASTLLSAFGGGTITLSSGTFSLEATVTLAESIHLVGQGITTKIVAGNGFSTIPIEKGNMIETASFDSFSMLSFYGNGHANRAILMGSGQQNVNIVDCSFYGQFFKASVMCNATPDPARFFSITDCYFENADTLGVGYQCSDIMISRNIINGGSGISLDKLDAALGSDRFIISDNVVRTTQDRCIFMAAPGNGIVSGNVLYQEKAGGGLGGVWLGSPMGRVLITNNVIRGPSAGIGLTMLNADDASVLGNTVRGFASGLTLDSNSQNLIVSDNDLLSNTVAASVSGAGIFRNNRGYVTESSGVGSILNGTTSIAVNHGLSVTPTIDDIMITLAESPTNDPGNIWVDTIGAAQFTVNCRNDPGASNLDFGWHIQVL